MNAPEALERGRVAHARRAWGEAYGWFGRAEADGPLGAADLELYAEAAYLVGRDDAFLTILDRAHHIWLDQGEPGRAARCAFWLGLVLMLRGETARASGWLGRARRLAGNGPESGYLLLPDVERRLRVGETEAAYAAASRAAEIGEEQGDRDLVACARHLQGRARTQEGRLAEGLALLDEAMVAVAEGELSPIMTGLVYCSVIAACGAVHALDRAREWTDALAGWCDAQPELVAFTGTCRVHRAEILQLGGAWPEAIAEARRACDRFAEGIDPRPPAAAFYQQGEVHRLRGEIAAAEESYREASRWGFEPQPGLALLRLAQGRTDAAVAAIRRAVAEAADPPRRSRLLPAAVEILLAAGDAASARDAAAELAGIAVAHPTDMLIAAAAQAAAAVALAEGEAAPALADARRAAALWRDLAVPYEEARARELAGLACRAMGDEEGARLELEAVARCFEELGAVPDRARLARRLGSEREPAGHGLTGRERQVLRLVAAGATNKEIAAELGLSVKTVDRHVSNILMKLDVPTRAAATGFAYTHRLV